MFYKIMIALALALACAMGGNHHGAHKSTPTTYSAADSTSDGDGENGHIRP